MSEPVPFLELCRRRQSVRRYDPARPVPRETIERCLEAARLAPSACNSQPWTFVVVDDPARRAAVAQAARRGIYGTMNAFIDEAPVLVAVVTGRSGYAARLGGQLRGVQYALIDIGIAAEHFALQAAEEGVGTCWLGWFDEKAVKQALGLPRGARIDILLAMGYAADPAVRSKNRKPRDEMARYA